MSEVCKKCGKILRPLEIALSRKLINRDGSRLYCIKCLAEHFQTDQNILLEKAEQVKQQGCTLFAGIDVADFSKGSLQVCETELDREMETRIAKKACCGTRNFRKT